MLRNNTGFTLIELMIVVAIIGVLAAIAIPLYQGSIVKTQVNRTLGELGSLRSAYEVNLTRSSGVTNETLGYTPSPLTTGDMDTEVALVNADGSGHIEVTMGGRAHPNLTGVIVRFERTETGAWSCVIDRSASSQWRGDYNPGNCTIL